MQPGIYHGFNILLIQLFKITRGRRKNDKKKMKTVWPVTREISKNLQEEERRSWGTTVSGKNVLQGKRKDLRAMSEIVGQKETITKFHRRSVWCF